MPPPERRPRQGLWLVASVALGLFAFTAAAPAAASKPPPEFYGVVPQVEPTPLDFQQMKEDRVGTVRLLVNWPWVEGQQGTYDWSRYDEFMRQATAAGIEVWPVLFGTPIWARPSGCEAENPETCAPTTDAARAGFANFAAAAAARYGPGGTFWTEPPPPPVDPPGCELLPVLCLTSRRVPPCECTEPSPIEVWQIWNEQNSPKYFGPRPNPGKYASLLEASAAAIRGNQPGAEIVLGGMWGPPGIDAVTPVTRYLDQLLRDGGVRDATDSIALHPYGANLRSVLSQVKNARSTLDRRGAGRVGIWISELGWASGGPRKEPLVTSKRGQAKLLENSYRMLLRKRRSWDIRGVHWYSWRDTSGGLCAWCPKSGLRTKSGGAKPAAKVFRSLPRSGY